MGLPTATGVLEAIPRPVVATGNDYPASYELDWHEHRRGQLLYAATGVISVETSQGAWIAPPERAVWIPARLSHAVKMIGAVTTRSIYIESQVWRSRDDRCEVIAVSPLLRALVMAACEIEPEYTMDGRDGLVMSLLVEERARAPVLPLAVPFPTDPTLNAKCRDFVERPSPHATIDAWSTALGIGRRTFTRTFKQQTGMSFAAWRQQASILVALPRLAQGDPVTAIALDLGYENPAAFTAMFKRVLGIAPSLYRFHT